MRIRIRSGLLLINIITALLIIVITLFPSNVLRIIFGLPFALFFPGYALMALLFPRKNQLGNVERMALSFGLSIAVVPLSGFALNYTPWGVSLYPVLISITIFILATSLAAWYRQWRLAEDERFTIPFQFSVFPWRKQGAADSVLSVILIVAILGAVGTLGYAIAAPKIGEKFTEFYLLGLEGKAIDYPRETKLGNKESVIVGIINQEHERASYWIEVRIDGQLNNEVGPLVLEHNEEWRETVSFTPHREGDSQKVEFVLYKNKADQPYLNALHFWINVTE